MQKTAARLESDAALFLRMVEELERVLTPASQPPSQLTPQAVPLILNNQHAYLVHVASKVGRCCCCCCGIVVAVAIDKALLSPPLLLMWRGCLIWIRPRYEFEVAIPRHI